MRARHSPLRFRKKTVLKSSNAHENQSRGQSLVFTSDAYGVPESIGVKLTAKNRVAWNRYLAADLGDVTRTQLIEEKRHPAEELTPFLAGGIGGGQKSFRRALQGVREGPGASAARR
jgi:hypothetical protein